MKVWSIDEPITLKKPVVTIGIFDGVHVGHRYILDHLKAEAASHGGESVVVTLWPHPRIVLNKDLQNFKLLHSKEEKVRELAKNDIDHLVIVPFSPEIAALSACDFVQQYLVDRLGVEVMLVGYDNRFGNDGKGDPEGLKKCAEKNAYRIVKLSEHDAGQGRVNSTAIREAILNGDR